MKIEKFNEFINDGEIYTAIEKAESTPSSNLEEISKKENYRKVVNMGEKIIPYLLERNSIIWDIALKELTGDGLDSLYHTTSERLEYWQKWSHKNGYTK
jgi:hypothetical protein